MLNLVLALLIVVLLCVMFWTQSKTKENYVNDVPDKKTYPSDEINREYDFPPNIEQWHPDPPLYASDEVPDAAVMKQSYWHPSSINLEPTLEKSVGVKMPFIPDHSKLIGSTTYEDEPITVTYNDNSEY